MKTLKWYQYALLIVSLGFIGLGIVASNGLEIFAGIVGIVMVFTALKAKGVPKDK